ncbi:uncharacterized protein LOC106085249 isoform X2 [Stomoxys calcitrans]|uniref:uncharacterized protein LOC106085249 isoform X2 n=1 Tax=Stomoxys calcitrans TaxID=35570 RepID=UPI0027E38AB0|nr:uncharacterized protein LOC106085249 isoform X2 [Stomoxys calcitrans]
MSWVHHHKPSTSSTNNTSSLLTSSSSLSSLAKTANPCSTAQQNFNINASTMPTSPMAAANVAQKQVLPPPTRPPFSSSSSASSLTATSVLRSQATSNNSSLLMTSQQYPNKTNLHTTTNSTMPSMRLSNTSNAPYTLAQQPQQQQRQQYIPPTATPQYGTPNNNTSTTNNHLVQGPFNNNQQNSWQTHSVTSQNYLPTSKMMPQMQPPLPTVGATNAGANNNWQSGQQNYQSSNMMYQQHAGGVAPQQHQQHQQQQWPQQNSAVNQQMYDNSFNHQQQQVSNNAYQQQQQQQAAAASYFQQAAAPQPQQQQQPLQTSLTNMSQTTTTNAVNFFDNANNNNNNNQSTGDGWGDWDWNDNSTIEANESAIQHQQQQQQQQISTQMHHPPQSQQQTQPPPPTAVAAPPPLPAVANDHNQAFNSSNIIADSFNQQSNDTWNWNATNAAVENVPAHVENKTALAKVEQQHNDNWNWTTTNEEDTQPQQQQQQQQTVVTNDHASNDNWNWSSNETNQQQIAQTTSTVQDIKQAVQPASKSVEAAAIMPLAPPPTEFSSSAVSENHNYNTNAAPQTSTSTNIPNTVFVSQAKPVTLPSRQYASPPMGNTPVSENPPTEGTALMPPQAFQNAEEAAVSRPTNLQSPALPPPTTTVPPPAGLPPAATAAAAGNPFKRSGLAQHHRATALMPTMPQASPAVFNMPPPPPADFANPSSSSNVTLMEPENNEIPSQENQEILAPPAAIMQPSLQPPTSTISLPNAATVAQPPNDERNQYLQTSHLSENSEDQQPEADGLLPPPGLSRLVLGEPELEASQRMVMGTDAPVLGSNATVADVMHLEERHADGEDTASENAVPVISGAMGGVGGQGSPPSTSDRNLYLVPGESNVNNQQRVVTGVELQEQREIEMDGENLEDQQQQQQQQQQQNHHHQQPQQQQHHNHHQPSPQTHQTLSPEARNEPPVEGAADIIEPSVPAPSVSQPLEQASDAHHHPHQPSKTKESHNNISSPNDDDDSDERLLNERAMDHSTAGSSKSRTKYDNERYGGRVRRSLNRYAAYASDEYVNSDGDGDYSSDREERERRERNDRRRNYREGSVRSDRGGDEDESKRNRRQQRDKRDKYYYEGEERPRAGERSKTDSRRSQRQRGYENDSRYETEESTRFDARKESSRRSMRHSEAAERNRRGDRSDQGGEYEDYPRKGQGYRSSKRSGENYESDRRDRRRGGDDYDNTIERRRRSDKHRDRDPRYNDPRYDPREYEEYRKHSSRNARDSDLEKEGGGGGGPPRSGRMHHDGRHAAAMYGGYPGGGYYDPYTAYYYQQMARNNPQAYAEWYKKYYGQHAAAVTAGSTQAMPASADTSLTAAANDGRESVHSGRSSAHNDLKDRYTHAYITQANEYHRHYHHHQQQQQHHHQQLQQHHHHQHHLQQMAFNQTHNSTMLVDEDSLNQSTSLYSGIGGGGGLSQAHSQTNLSQIHGGYYVTPSVLQTAAAAGAHATPSLYYARSDYAESRSGAISVRDPDPIASEPQRLTPCKFINEHAVVSFGSGILVTVKPKYTPHGQISNIVKLLKFKPNDETRKLFKVFPGPLVRGLTHKKTVIEFCQEQIRLGPMETTIYAKQLISNNAEKYRASYTLMWNLLILLLKQNGMVVGTDIAELLLKNQQQFAYQTPNNSMNNSLKSKSGSTSPVAEDNEAIKDDADIANNEESKEDKDQELRESSEEKMPSSSSNALSETEITEKFRNYLLYGNVNEALEWATDNNLWGHALFLASKLDRRSHANVMMKFANKLALNDPLQTLYQLMSGRSPSSVTCVQDEKWGDWRPHLSMILSNTSQKPELDRKAITTLGDSLFNRGDLYAAHFCYLMAQVGFGRYQESATQENTLQQHLPKLVLLGSSHYKQFQEFAHNEAIVMTEIYEYACSLNDDKFSIVEFQPYKFILATRLLDYGFHLKSLMYLEQISVHIARDPTKYESSFINKVYEMADRLKYYDPVLEKTIDDQQQLGNEEGDNALNTSQQQLEEQKWLQSLRQMAQQYKIDYAVPANSAVDSQQQQVMDPSFGYQQQHIDQQFMEINKQFSELNLQYQDQQQQQPQPQQQPTFYNPDLMQQQPQQTQNSMLATDAQQQPLSLDPYQTQNEMPAMQANEQQQTLDANQSSTTAQTDVYHQQTAAYMQPDMTSYGQNYYDPTQQQQGLQNYNNEGGHMDATQTTDSGSYDYWAQQQQQVTTAQPYGLDEHESPPHAQTQALEGQKSAATPKNSTNNSQGEAVRAAAATPKATLLLNNKKSQLKMKTNHNMMMHASPGHLSSQYNKAKLEKVSKLTTTILANTNSSKTNFPVKKSPEVSTKQAFNKLLEYETSSTPSNTQTTLAATATTTTPFSINNNARPTISMPKSKTYDTDDESSGKKQQAIGGGQKSTTGSEGKIMQQQTAQKNKENKNNAAGNQNSGWFGGIWNKFSLKPKNQMILPDDKNPSIVWDPEKKKWVNTDGDEQEEESFKPPPKMGDMMMMSQANLAPPQSQPQQNQMPSFMDPQQQQQQQYVPTSLPNSASSPNPMQQQQQQQTSAQSNVTAATNPNAPGPTKTPTLQSNMFKMQRNRTLKNAYVDVFNPSGAPVNKAAENVLAPALPPAAVPQSGFFIPGGSGSTAGGVSQDNNGYQQQQQPQDTPQFYNPNQYGTGTGY